MANVHDVASYIMIKVGPTTTMKLQKLVFYAQAWSLVLRKAPLFAEPVQAWKMGPVVAQLHGKHRGMRNLRNWPHGDSSRVPPRDVFVLDLVIQMYGHKSPEHLSTMSHQEGPWRETRHGLDDSEPCRREISHESMARYYSDNKLRIIGRAYEEGRLTLDGVASVLGVSRSDAVALLEKSGFHRPVEVIRLSDEQRKTIGAKLRAERMRRAGHQASSDSLVSRSVIATQRIEGVDARPWFKR